MDEIENESYSPSTLDLPIDLEIETTDIETEKGKNRIKRKVRLQSDVWKHFTMIEGGDPMDPRAACNYCGKGYAADHRKHGTSSSGLWNHYNHHCVQNSNKGDGSEEKEFEPKKEEGDLVDMPLTEEACRHAVAQYIASEKLPYSIVEGQGFRQFIQTFLPNFEFSSATVARDICQLHLDKGENKKDSEE
ncbi:uncharacterized protein LOC133797761 isoform X1 [Humulus lupulus]|uniref:uncharacterized protein LOC133797761 isoform X1 n=1 Tax=Humulus lupulus TaxID=3486 RepID=UPI002B40BE7C|nr:uncharacterized protein LOC133797761 isoform X1 [Humulus lupulus]XP_062091789.1 uncharacterized protein LOC133797761 isoform X1 [Humulus lupulus]